jgi:FRG domain-containing protein
MGTPLTKIACEHRASDLKGFLEIVLETQRRWRKETVEEAQKGDPRETSGVDPRPFWIPWFRGEPDATGPTPLYPKLYRPEKPIDDLLLLEQELRLEFRRCGAQLVERQPRNRWEWYFLMQHYGVPTRLLDWTDGALLALFFALKRPSEKDTVPAAVYMLDPWWLNSVAFSTFQVDKQLRSNGPALTDWREAKEYLPKDEFDTDDIGTRFPLAIDPSHFSQRFAAQRSRFTIFGRCKDGMNAALEQGPGKLLNIVVEGDFNGLRTELRTLGISESVIFPDLDGLGRELNERFDIACLGNNLGLAE